VSESPFAFAWVMFMTIGPSSSEFFLTEENFAVKFGAEALQPLSKFWLRIGLAGRVVPVAVV
jgi:hypothetical protein